MRKQFILSGPEAPECISLETRQESAAYFAEEAFPFEPAVCVAYRAPPTLRWGSR